MILIGQYDSPFVRRVGIALTLYRLPYEHRPWSITGDADRIRPLNPLLRVPVLVLPDGEALIETYAILDHLDRLVPAARRRIASRGETRRRHLGLCALASGLSDMAVSLFYEKRLHPAPSDFLVARRRAQISGALDRLEEARQAISAPFWFGRMPGHADVAVAAALRHLAEAHPALDPFRKRPQLSAFAERCEALPVFRRISQPFVAPP